MEEGLSLAAELGNESDAAYCLEGLAGVAVSEGDPAGAARLWGASERLRERTEGAATPDRSTDQRAAASGALGEAAFEALRAEGRALSPEEAAGSALKGLRGAPAPASRRAGVEVLALGEARVLRDSRVLAASDWKYAKSRLDFSHHAA